MSRARADPARNPRLEVLVAREMRAGTRLHGPERLDHGVGAHEPARAPQQLDHEVQVQRVGEGAVVDQGLDVAPAGGGDAVVVGGEVDGAAADALAEDDAEAGAAREGDFEERGALGAELAGEGLLLLNVAGDNCFVDAVMEVFGGVLGEEGLDDFFGAVGEVGEGEEDGAVDEGGVRAWEFALEKGRREVDAASESRPWLTCLVGFPEIQGLSGVLLVNEQSGAVWTERLADCSDYVSSKVHSFQYPEMVGRLHSQRYEMPKFI